MGEFPPLLDLASDVFRKPVTPTPVPPVWHAATLENSWVDFESGHQEARYRKNTDGTVHIQGLVKSGTTTANTVVLTLPVGYRPDKDLLVPVAVSGSNQADWATIKADGELWTGAGWSATWTSISITFQVTQ